MVWLDTGIPKVKGLAYGVYGADYNGVTLSDLFFTDLLFSDDYIEDVVVIPISVTPRTYITAFKNAFFWYEQWRASLRGRYRFGDAQ